MTSVAATEPQDLLGKALVGFCQNNEFPEEDIVTRKVLDGDLPRALDTLNAAKRELEVNLPPLKETNIGDLCSQHFIVRDPTYKP